MRSRARSATAPRCSTRRLGLTWAIPTGRPRPPGRFCARWAGSPGGSALLSTTPWNGQPVNPECAAAARAAATLCETLGHRVEEARPEINAPALGLATRIIIGAHIRVVLEARAAALGRELSADDVERVTWARAIDGRTYAAADYARAIGIVHRTGRVVGRFFTDHDVLLSPTMCQPPYQLGVLDMMSQDSEAYLAAVLASVGFTSLFNAAGNPAISVPPRVVAGWPPARCPVRGAFRRRGHPLPSRGAARGGAALGGSPTRARTGGSRASAGRWERVMVSPLSRGHREQRMPCLTRPNQEGAAATFRPILGHPRCFSMTVWSDIGVESIGSRLCGLVRLGHPYAVAMETVHLAPNAQVSLYRGRTPRTRSRWRCAIRTFRGVHQPVTVAH